MWKKLIDLIDLNLSLKRIWPLSSPLYLCLSLGSVVAFTSPCLEIEALSHSFCCSSPCLFWSPSLPTLSLCPYYMSAVFHSQHIFISIIMETSYNLSASWFFSSSFLRLPILLSLSGASSCQWNTGSIVQRPGVNSAGFFSLMCLSTPSAVPFYGDLPQKFCCCWYSF